MNAKINATSCVSVLQEPLVQILHFCVPVLCSDVSRIAVILFAPHSFQNVGCHTENSLLDPRFMSGTCICSADLFNELYVLQLPQKKFLCLWFGDEDCQPVRPVWSVQGPANSCNFSGSAFFFACAADNRIVWSSNEEV